MEPAFPPVDGVAHHFAVLPTGIRMHYAEAGPEDGPPVVLLHGWPQHWWCWRGVIPRLVAAGYRVIAPDLRGCGWTDAPEGGYEKERLADDVLALLDALDLERVALVGHDWGGWTAQLLALKAPERVTQLTLVNIAPVASSVAATLPHLWRFLYQWIIASPLGAALQRSPLFAVAYPGVARRDRKVYMARMREPGRARAGQLYYRRFVLSEFPALARGRYDGQTLAPPTLVLHGLDDPVIRPSMVEGYRALARDPTILWLRGVGHFVADEQPDAVADRLLAFLA